MRGPIPKMHKRSALAVARLMVTLRSKYESRGFIHEADACQLVEESAWMLANASGDEHRKKLLIQTIYDVLLYLFYLGRPLQ